MHFHHAPRIAIALLGLTALARCSSDGDPAGTSGRAAPREPPPRPSAPAEPRVHRRRPLRPLAPRPRRRARVGRWEPARAPRRRGMAEARAAADETAAQGAGSGGRASTSGAGGSAGSGGVGGSGGAGGAGGGNATSSKMPVPPGPTDVPNRPARRRTSKCSRGADSRPPSRTTFDDSHASQIDHFADIKRPAFR